MTTRLIFIGGPPGIGKSTVARELLERMDDGVWLDGDDLWRTKSFKVTESRIRMVEANIQFVLRSFLREGFVNILFTWILQF